MAIIACPACGEDEALEGTRSDAHTLDVECTACGAAWQRHTDRRCALCGSTDLKYTPRDVLERSRGNQHTPTGRIDAWACYSCGGRDVTGPHPEAGDPADLLGGDLREGWARHR